MGYEGKYAGDFERLFFTATTHNNTKNCYY